MSSELMGAAMLQQCHCHENEAACMLAAVLVDGHTKCIHNIQLHANAINHRH